MMLSGAAIAAATGGKLLADGPAGPLMIDSRRLAPGSWFVTLAGDRFDGHDFLPHAAAAGCAGAIVCRPPENWTAGLVVVPDALEALQRLGAYVRENLDCPVVGITGSAGKTSTRVMVVEVLKALGQVHHTQGNLNNHIGLPLTLLATPPDADVVVLEMGMNHPGEIALLAGISAPNVRLITNVGAAHVEGCGSIEGVARAKQELFDSSRPGDIVCLNMDDPRIAAMPLPAGVRVIRYGSGPEATVRLTDVAVDPVRLQTRLRIETPDGVVRATLQVPGAHLAINAAAAVAVAYALRVPVHTLSAAIGRFMPEGMRNRVEHLGDLLVLDDAYNANPLSMIAALQTLSSLPGTRFAVLGDMLELGGETVPAHRQVLEEARRLGIQSILVTGEQMTAVGIGESFVDVNSLTAELVRSLQALPAGSPRAVLVKGSRGAKMERVLERLRAEWKCSTS